jgi:hypothetical protein
MAEETGRPGGYAAVDVGYPEPGRAGHGRHAGLLDGARRVEGGIGEQAHSSDLDHGGRPADELDRDRCWRRA